MRIGALVLAAMLCLLVGPAMAAEPRRQDAGTGAVGGVLDFRTLALADGRIVRLLGINLPGAPSSPILDTAKEALAQLVLGRTVRMWFAGTHIDRYGRLLVHAYDDQGRWVQGSLLAQGLVRVESAAENRGSILAMQEIEDVARAASLGVWSDPHYSVRSVDDIAQYLNRYEILEGRVRAADVVDGRVYLNFGPDWRTDFTVSVAPGDARTFRREGINLLTFAGQRVRVRGWVRVLNGPMMDVTHPEQIQLLSP